MKTTLAIGESMPPDRVSSELWWRSEQGTVRLCYITIQNMSYLRKYSSFKRTSYAANRPGIVPPCQHGRFFTYLLCCCSYVVVVVVLILKYLLCYVVLLTAQFITYGYLCWRKAAELFTPLYSYMDIGRVVGVREGGLDTSPPPCFSGRAGRQTDTGA